MLGVPLDIKAINETQNKKLKLIYDRESHVLVIGFINVYTDVLSVSLTVEYESRGNENMHN